MDLVLDWSSIHRSDEDMNPIFQTSDFDESCSDIKNEDEEINIFSFCRE